MADTCICRRIDAPQAHALRGVLSRGASMRGVWLRRSSVRDVSVRDVSMCRVSSLPLAQGIVRLALARCSTEGFATIGPRHAGDTPTKASYGCKTPHDASVNGGFWGWLQHVLCPEQQFEALLGCVPV